MRKLNLLLLFIPVFILTSCDPAQNIEFINQGKSDLKVKLIVNPQFKTEAIYLENTPIDQVIKGDSIVFTIKSGNPKETERFIYFGKGKWRDDHIHEIAKSLKSIEIENTDHKVVYKSEDAINNLFLKNKKGILFKSIDIIVDEDFFD